MCEVARKAKLLHGGMLGFEVRTVIDVEGIGRVPEKEHGLLREKPKTSQKPVQGIKKIE